MNGLYNCQSKLLLHYHDSLDILEQALLVLIFYYFFFSLLIQSLIFMLDWSNIRTMHTLRLLSINTFNL